MRLKKPFIIRMQVGIQAAFAVCESHSHQGLAAAPSELVLLSVRFPLGREHIAAFSTVSDTNQPLLLRLTAEVKNRMYVETNPSWIELKKVCGQVCFASHAVFQIHDFAVQRSLSGTRSLCLVGLLAHLYLKLLCN